MKRNGFATAAGGGLCGKGDGSKNGKNLRVNLGISFGTKAINWFIDLSTVVSKNLSSLILLNSCQYMKQWLA